MGEMLCDQLSKRADVVAIVTIDKEPQSEYSKSIPKLTYIEANLADEGWQTQVAAFSPTVVIHTAWQIRTLYGQADTQWRWNVDGSDAVFNFAFTTPSVKKLIHFSTAASYAAYIDNDSSHRFTEAEGFRDDEYLYAKEKKVVEERLAAFYTQKQDAGEVTPQIFIVRPAAITGPRGRYMRIRFGLQSALQGNLRGGALNRLVTLLTAYVPATKGWVRQFIHEDDVTDIVAKFAFEPFASGYEAFNMTPEGPLVFAPDMAKAVGKKVLWLHPQLIRFAFFCCWHLTRGKIPTSAGVWRFYSYPIVMSGAKLATVYQCQYSCLDALTYTDGRYADWVPTAAQKPKPKQ